MDHPFDAASVRKGSHTPWIARGHLQHPILHLGSSLFRPCPNGGATLLLVGRLLQTKQGSSAVGFRIGAELTKNHLAAQPVHRTEGIAPSIQAVRNVSTALPPLCRPACTFKGTGVSLNSVRNVVRACGKAIGHQVSLPVALVWAWDRFGRSVGPSPGAAAAAPRRSTPGSSPLVDFGVQKASRDARKLHAGTADKVD